MIDEIFDLGDTVLCDICNEDYTVGDNVNVSGGWIFSGYAYCPKCATPEAMDRIRQFGEDRYIEAICPEGMPFKDFVLESRVGNNTLMIESW